MKSDGHNIRQLWNREEFSKASFKTVAMIEIPFFTLKNYYYDPYTHYWRNRVKWKRGMIENFTIFVA